MPPDRFRIPADHRSGQRPSGPDVEGPREARLRQPAKVSAADRTAKRLQQQIDGTDERHSIVGRHDAGDMIRNFQHFWNPDEPSSKHPHEATRCTLGVFLSFEHVGKTSCPLPQFPGGTARGKGLDRME